MWKPGGLACLEISLCSYFYGRNYCAFIWTSGLARLLKISLENGEILLTRLNFFPYKHSQAGWLSCPDESSKMPLQAIFNNCQNNKIVPAGGMTFSHINTRENHPAYRGQPWLPYNQSLSLTIICLTDFHINLFLVMTHIFLNI